MNGPLVNICIAYGELLEKIQDFTVIELLTVYTTWSSKKQIPVFSCNNFGICIEIITILLLQQEMYEARK